MDINNIGKILYKRIPLDIIPHIIKHFPVHYHEKPLPTKWEVDALMHQFSHEKLVDFYAMHKNYNVVDYVIKQSQKINKRFLESCLCSCCEYDNLLMVKVLLNNDVSPCAWENYALRHSVLRNNIAVVELLLKTGQVNIDDWDGCALFWAISNEQLNIVKLLIKYGANLEKMRPPYCDLRDYIRCKEIITYLDCLQPE